MENITLKINHQDVVLRVEMPLPSQVYIPFYRKQEDTFTPTGTLISLDEFIHDIKNLLPLSLGEDVIEESWQSLRKTISLHLDKHKRMLDHDLKTYIGMHLLLLDSIFDMKNFPKPSEQEKTEIFQLLCSKLSNISSKQYSDELIQTIFSSMCQSSSSCPIYYDVINEDVLSYNEGYFSPLLGDQNISNRMLMNKIMNGYEQDYIDECRHILIEKIRLNSFLSEYKQQTSFKEPFYSFPDIFLSEILKEYSPLKQGLQPHDILFTGNMNDKFDKSFTEKHISRLSELKDDYMEIFRQTKRSIVLKWLEENC